MKMPNNLILASRIFTLNDQNIFAQFSGDFNPIHIDPIQARRTITGQCVTHGIHGLMWALESFLSTFNKIPSSIRVKFLKPIFLNEKVNCVYDESTKKLKITSDLIVLVDVSLIFDSNVEATNFVLKCNNVPKIPIERDVEELTKLPTQKFFFRGEVDLATSIFPNISNAYSSETCCEIAAISEIVGMQTPGLHSLFLSAEIFFQRNKSEPVFFIKNIDTRFNLIKIEVNATSLMCKINSLLRQKPIKGPTLTSLQNKVNDNEFHNVKALIIGGSRGLGESVAKLIALGNGESVITYATGYEDCLKLSKDISSIEKKCSIAKIKIPDDIHLLNTLGEFNQIYYFPTPKISSRRGGNYDKNLYINYREIYVDSFRLLLNSFNKATLKTSIFYPSSTLIDESLPDFTEYIDAKKAGENVCKEFKGLSKLSVLFSRIPRVRTDQTMQLINTALENPEDVMLPIVREMTSLN